jgi:hypothetical protein
MVRFLILESVGSWRFRLLDFSFPVESKVFALPISKAGNFELLGEPLFVVCAAMNSQIQVLSNSGRISGESLGIIGCYLSI